jgi:Flp pilus assembly protein TadG
MPDGPAQELRAMRTGEVHMERVHSRRSSERGQALLETAIALPLVLLVSAGIFEFGRAYQTWQVLTNAAREGARVAILPSATSADVQSRVQTALQSGQLSGAASATISVNQNATVSIGAANAGASVVTINYPFSFIVLNPVVNLVVKGSLVGTPLTMVATAEMRNEAQ